MRYGKTIKTHLIFLATLCKTLGYDGFAHAA
jgi:hypothetical protein